MVVNTWIQLENALAATSAVAALAGHNQQYNRSSLIINTYFSSPFPIPMYRKSKCTTSSGLDPWSVIEIGRGIRLLLFAFKQWIQLLRNSFYPPAYLSRQTAPWGHSALCRSLYNRLWTSSSVQHSPGKFFASILGHFSSTHWWLSEFLIYWTIQYILLTE